MGTELERCLAFVRAFDERRARRTVPYPYGKALFNDELSHVRDLNVLTVDAGAMPTVDELTAEADRLQGEAGLEHRKLAIDDDDLGLQLEPGLTARGWVAGRNVVMPHVGPGHAVDTARVTEVEAEEMIPVWTEGLRSAFGADEEVVRQHVAAQLLRREAVHVRYFAAREAARPMSYCELFSDGETGQIESVLTLPEHRGRGLATAVISRALEASRAMGHGLTFLLADEGDWPKELYAKLGFEVAGRVWDFTKSKALDRQRLQRIRLRTPRLELRLASRDELVALAEIALAGIHPPEEMPFAVAWTDDATVESFLAHHEGVLERWSTDDWHLLLVVFLDGVPIGSQGVSGEQFGERRDVVTGSWLGLPFHGRGYGTEMRAAVLELAFRGLGAEVARSGSLEGNIASARVSEKLGYEPAGEGMVLPRGTPVREQRYRLTRERWSTPVEVELEGLEPCLPLFGATSARSR